MTESQPALAHCIALLNLEQEVRDARSEIELGFLMVNRSSFFIESNFIVYWQQSESGKITIKQVSNISDIQNQASPLIQKLEQLCKHLLSGIEQNVRALSGQEFASLELEQFYGWNKAVALWCPLKSCNTKNQSGLIFFREATAKNSEWQDEDIMLAKRLSEMYGFALQTFRNKVKKNSSLKHIITKPFVIIAAISLLMLIPVKQSVIAPASIIAQEPDIVTAPLEGVIDKILIKPNDTVINGQVLFQFEQSSLKNHYEVASKVLKVAEAKYQKTQQLSFNNSEMKAQLALLKAQMEQRSAEVKYARQLMDRTIVRAFRQGIVIIDDINSLIGKPVQVGEKIMTIADPDQIEIEIELAIEDAIIMDPGAAVELFLNIEPANALAAELYYVGYSASVTTQGVLAYRLLARFIPSSQSLPRIGLKGSAKIYGSRVSLFYYLFRRPLSVLRQSLGF